jgi:hypothetical protein
MGGGTAAGSPHSRTSVKEIVATMMGNFSLGNSLLSSRCAAHPEFPLNTLPGGPGDLANRRPGPGKNPGRLTGVAFSQ